MIEIFEMVKFESFVEASIVCSLIFTFSAGILYVYNIISESDKIEL